MSAPAQPLRAAAPLGLFPLLAVAAALYLLLLVNCSGPISGGEAAFEDAFAALYLTGGLWIVLAAMLVVAAIPGATPRWAAILAFFMVPLSGVAAFVAIDMVSRRVGWAIVFPAALPPLLAFYALWGRLPRLHATLPPQPTSLTIWGGVVVLTAASLVLANWF